MRRFKPAKLFVNEEALCRRFAEAARAHGFKVYSEAGGFDLLLVAGEDCKGFKPGDQVGVQAKMLPNIKVLAQSLWRPTREAGPHYYAVLVPEAEGPFKDIATALRITAISGNKIGSTFRPFSFTRTLWWRVEPAKLCWVPDCEVMDMPAGVPSPRQLTEWKMKAVKLCLHGEKQGYLTRADFVQFGISITRWVKTGWIQAAAGVLVKGRWRVFYTLCADKLPPHVKNAELAEALAEALAQEAS